MTITGTPPSYSTALANSSVTQSQNYQPPPMYQQHAQMQLQQQQQARNRLGTAQSGIRQAGAQFPPQQQQQHMQIQRKLLHHQQQQQQQQLKQRLLQQQQQQQLLIPSNATAPDQISTGIQNIDNLLNNTVAPNVTLQIRTQQITNQQPGLQQQRSMSSPGTPVSARQSPYPAEAFPPPASPTASQFPPAQSTNVSIASPQYRLQRAISTSTTTTQVSGTHSEYVRKELRTVVDARMLNNMNQHQQQHHQQQQQQRVPNNFQNNLTGQVLQEDLDTLGLSYDVANSGLGQYLKLTLIFNIETQNFLVKSVFISTSYRLLWKRWYKVIQSHHYSRNCYQTPRFLSLGQFYDFFVLYIFQTEFKKIEILNEVYVGELSIFNIIFERKLYDHPLIKNLTVMEEPVIEENTTTSPVISECYKVTAAVAPILSKFGFDWYTSRS
ncbi:unnamed protein product [Trichogramma brassicae]|uniref:Uncharacterized protein n=1 Tax=Trichogramma brassicae TaxID=86971 RepID=A0A6H5IFA4_9HYME|nr:unnamed protein product [Trichogramma brassicae]